MEKEGYTLRCMRCLQGRFTVPWSQPEARCPHCGQEWRITWVTPQVAKIRGKVLKKEAEGGAGSLYRPV